MLIKWLNSFFVPKKYLCWLLVPKDLHYIVSPLKLKTLHSLVPTSVIWFVDMVRYMPTCLVKCTWHATCRSIYMSKQTNQFLKYFKILLISHWKIIKTTLICPRKFSQNTKTFFNVYKNHTKKFLIHMTYHTYKNNDSHKTFRKLQIYRTCLCYWTPAAFLTTMQISISLIIIIQI